MITQENSPPAVFLGDGRRMVNYTGLRTRFGIIYTRSTIWKLERAGKFPRHVALGENSIAWIEGEVVAWLEAKIAARPAIPAPAGAAQEPALDQLQRSVAELNLSVRSANALRNEGIGRIGDLVQKTEAEMLRARNFGRKSLNEIKEVLAQMGLHFGMEIPNWPPADEISDRRGGDRDGKR